MTSISTTVEAVAPFRLTPFVPNAAFTAEAPARIDAAKTVAIKRCFIVFLLEFKSFAAG